MGPKDPHNGLAPPAFEGRSLGFLGLGIVALGVVFCLQPIPQDLNDHGFTDDRTILGVPNFLNVVSNLPFLVVGAAGIVAYWLYRMVRLRRPIVSAASA